MSYEVWSTVSHTHNFSYFVMHVKKVLFCLFTVSVVVKTKNGPN